MPEQFAHDVLLRRTSEEQSRQAFAKNLKIHLATSISPGNRVVYDNDIAPELAKKLGREPKTRHEIRKPMESHPYYRMWSSLQRSSQEVMWDAVGESVERQLDDLIERAKKLGKGQTKGSLRLDPSLEVPSYLAGVDTHCQPGSYYTEVTQDDVYAGAVYDRVTYIYTMGRIGPLNEDMGLTAVDYLKEQHPDFSPSRILDMGCSVGQSTLPYVREFPDAEVHGIDIGGPMLRYGHARAESLGASVHFSQQNAEHTDFDDESFDLIVSHILLHETSSKALDNICAEARRLLRPGGLMLHIEVPQYEGMHVFDQFMLDWDTYYNNEPFWGGLHDKDLKKVAVKAGFDASQVIQAMQPMHTERQAHRLEKFECGDFAGGGAWFIFGAQK